MIYIIKKSLYITLNKPFYACKSGLYLLQSGVTAPFRSETVWLESGKGIATEYGKIFVNEEIPFEENFNACKSGLYLLQSGVTAPFRSETV